MKNVDLNAYGVEEMNKQEMTETNGGICLASIVVGLIVGLIILVTEV